MKILINELKSNNYYQNRLAFRSNTTVAQPPIPNLKQDNEYYCAPTCAANAVLHLARVNNYSEMNKDPKQLVSELAQSLKTSPHGTTSDNLCKGLENYIKSNGYKTEIKYYGFRPVDAKYKRDMMPDLARIKNDLDEGKAVILNIGIYKKQLDENGKSVYVRDSGHYVNAVGHGSNGISQDFDYISITDPYDKVNSRTYVKLNKINEGKFIHNANDDEKVLTDNAKGFYEVGPKFNYFEPDEMAVLNGAISVNAY